MSRKTTVVVVTILIAGTFAALAWLRHRASTRLPIQSEETSGDQPQPPSDSPDTSRIIRMLGDSSWRVRLAGASVLQEHESFSLDRRATLLTEMLDHEATNPELGPPRVGSYMPLTSALQLQYVALLQGLGPKVTKSVREVSSPSSPDGREWRILALAAVEAPEVTPYLRELLTGSRDPAVRMTAARYLGYYKDRESIPLLRRALSDSFRATALSDTPGIPETPIYPVREQAAGALQRLGIKIQRSGNTFTTQ